MQVLWNEDLRLFICRPRCHWFIDFFMLSQEHYQGINKHAVTENETGLESALVT